MPDSVKNCLEEGINLYRLHTNRHGRLVHYRYDEHLSFCLFDGVSALFVASVFKTLAYYVCHDLYVFSF